MPTSGVASKTAESTTGSAPRRVAQVVHGTEQEAYADAGAEGEGEEARYQERHVVLDAEPQVRQPVGRRADKDDAEEGRGRAVPEQQVRGPRSPGEQEGQRELDERLSPEGGELRGGPF